MGSTSLSGNFGQAILGKRHVVRAAGQPAVVPAAAGYGDPLTQLRALASIHAEGLITDEEFAAKRAEILGRM